MDELMSEASDVVLFRDKTDSISGQSVRSRSNCGERPFDSYVTSVCLMQSAIINSIKNKYIEIEVTEGKTIKRKKSKRYKEPTGSPHVDIQSLELNRNSRQTPTSYAKDENVSVEEETQPDISHTAFTKLLEQSKFVEDGSQCKTSETIPTEAMEKEVEANKRNVENGLKLARRKFSYSIFENCSTYNLTCSEVFVEKDDILSTKEHSNKEPDTLPVVDKPSEITTYKPWKSQESVKTEIEDPISLSDSFFANVLHDDDDSRNDSYFRRRITPSKDVKSLDSTGNNELTDLDASYDKLSGAHVTQNGERRLSKKVRKQQKKKKKKNCSAYTCPKCLVSYVLSPNAVTSTARCLHCDYWTDVEPVFVKQEKIVWNICQIC